MTAILDASPDWFTLTDPLGRARWVSRGVERTLGYTAASRIGRSPLELVAPDEQELVFSQVADAIASSAEEVVFAARVLDATGAYRDIESRCVNRISDPRIEGLIFVSRDVTERADAQRALDLQREINDAVNELTATLNRLSGDTFDVGMTSILERAAALLGADRAFAVVIGADGLFRGAPHEWRRDGLGAVADRIDTRWPAELDSWFVPGQTLTIDLARLAKRIPYFAAGAQPDECSTAVVAPVTWADGLRGLVGVASVTPPLETSRHELLVRGLAGAIGGAVVRRAADERSHSHERALVGSRDAQDVIASISTLFVKNLTHDLDGTILEALESLRQHLGVPRTSMFRCDADDRLRMTHEATGPGVPSIQGDLPNVTLKDLTDLSSLLADGQIVVTSATDDDRRLIDIIEVAGKPPLITMMYVPMIVEGVIIGMVCVATHAPRSYDGPTLTLVRTFAEIFSGMIARREAEQRHSHAALHDPLTGLANRALLNDRLDQAIARCRRTGNPLGIVFLDCDNFKEINDSLGHDSGDALLVELSRRLRHACRPSDTVARFGGDEFVVVTEVSSGELAMRDLANRLLAAFRQSYVVDGRTLEVSASVGLVIRSIDRGDYVSGSALLRMADIAMYRAKSLGRNRIELFTDEMDILTRRRFDLQTDLRRALQSEQFAVAYQPIFNAITGEIVSAEALLRWNHPERGLLAPGSFIEVAEESGLIKPIGTWILARALADFAQIIRDGLAGPNTTVSVNASARQLADPAFVRMVETGLTVAGVEPRRLQIELTEGILADPATVIPQLLSLHEAGVSIAIDDFGTGYSSLAYLRDVPSNVLKIDRSFVQGLGTDKRDEALVRAIVTIAKDLNLTTVAEGVETVEQLERLRELGCDNIQGFLLARPESVDVYRQLLLAESCPIRS